MKKLLLLTLPFIFLSTSCEKKDDFPKIFSYYQEKLETPVYIDNNELMTLYENSEDFILYLFSDCGCSQNSDTVLSTLKSYIKTSHRLIYAIGNTDYQKLEIKYQDNFPLYPSLSYEELEKIPALYFYKQGKLVKEQYFSQFMLDKDSLGSYIEDHSITYGVNVANDVTPYSYKGYYFVKMNEEGTTLLNGKVEGNSTILFSWKECNDCFSLKSILSEYLMETEIKLYIYEVHHFRNGENKSTLWDDKENGFPYKYQFDSYRGGKVPSFVTYSNKKKVNMLVYHNDVVENGVVKESFFEELIGKKLSEEEREEYHKNKVIEYLNDLKVRK